MSAMMIVIYRLKPDQDPAAFEAWLRDVDIPGYARMSSLRNPTHFRADGLLCEAAPPPFADLAIIEMTSPDAVEAELSDPSWADFVADFERRTADAQFVVARQLHP